MVFIAKVVYTTTIRPSIMDSTRRSFLLFRNLFNLNPCHPNCI